MAGGAGFAGSGLAFASLLSTADALTLGIVATACGGGLGGPSGFGSSSRFWMYQTATPVSVGAMMAAKKPPRTLPSDEPELPFPSIAVPSSARDGVTHTMNLRQVTAASQVPPLDGAKKRARPAFLGVAQSK
jgi:hypothetical protein